jgi:hypothetical protein
MYITKDKIVDFIIKMWDAGIKVEADPKGRQLVVTKPGGGYEWIPVYEKASFNDLVNSFLPNNNVDEQ